jgi:hypothetical protein
MLALTALGAAGVAGAGGCGRIRPWSAPPTQAPDVDVLAGVIAAERSMISRYRSVISGFPGLGPALTSLLRQHEEHLAQLQGRLVVPPGSPYRPSPSPSGGSQAPAGLPATAAAALAYLRAAERDEAAALVRRLATVTVTPSLAQLMASIGASEASHEAVLASAALLHAPHSAGATAQ